MTIEQRIINVAEKQNYYDSRELRAIALEVRKREDRIKQLEEEIMEVKNKHSVLVADVVLDEDRADRIKRLENLGKELRECASQIGWTSSEEPRWLKRAEAAVEAWDKEVNP